MTKEQLKNIFIENKYIASDEWSDENPFVCIDLDTLYGILEKEKQQLIDEACEWLFKNNSYAIPTNIQVDRLREHLNNIKWKGA